uniref:Serpentine receptor class gamma n=1 Tax=Caenorhabditis tropicalis TaxID=1561998 RepID=A0A1I7T6E4_9PELO
MEHYTTNSWLEEANAGAAGIISLIANILLIFLTSKVKSYSDTTIMYLNEVKSLYIVKGGIAVHPELGRYLLILFLVFVVTFCTGPSVQYLQVAYLLSNPALKNHSVLRTTISLIPLFVAIPTFVLILNGYTPNQYEMEISKGLIEEITGRSNSSFLIESEEKVLKGFR